MSDRDIPSANISGTGVGVIGNYYGGLEILEWEGKFWWAIENYHGRDWDEIPEALYRDLERYEAERLNQPIE